MRIVKRFDSPAQDKRHPLKAHDHVFMADRFLDGGRVRVEIWGAGPDVFLIPGLASATSVWEQLAHKLEGSHRLHIFQVAGFGDVPVGLNSTGPIVQPLVAAITEYLDDLPFRRCAVIGHSLGGLAALLLAAERPSLVRRVMVMDTLPFAGLMFASDATVASIAPQAELIRARLAAQSQADYAEAARRSFPQLCGADSPEAELAAQASASSNHDVVARAVHDTLSIDARTRLPMLPQPVTVLYPTDGGAGPATLYATAYAAAPTVRLRPVEGSRHFIMLDQPAVFGREVKDFLHD